VGSAVTMVINLTREFDCIDCGVHTVTFAWPNANCPSICPKCAWLRSFDDPEARQRARDFLEPPA
jgi:hypothetical protein